jgi:hypothetical protein
MQRRFSRAFKRHVHIRKNLISQILFLFLNFAVFWLPTEIIILYTKNRLIKDAAQVIKSFNILLDPLIIIGFDTRFKSAAKQLLSTWPFDQFTRSFNINRQQAPSHVVQPTIKRRLKRLRQTTNQQTPTQPTTRTSTWNMGNNDDITMLEPVSNHSSQNQKQQSSQHPTRGRRRSSIQRIKITENHV